MTASLSCVLALVLVLDVSLSVDESRWVQQRDGHAEAFTSQTIYNYIQTNGRIAVSTVAFADESSVLIDWTMLENRLDVINFSQTLRNLSRPQLGVLTKISSGVRLAEELLTQNSPCNAERLVIDVAADGHETNGYDRSITERLQTFGIQVNGLAIENPRPELDLGVWFRENVVTSDGFVVVSRGFEEIAVAVRRKLEIEILGSVILNDYIR